MSEAQHEGGGASEVRGSYFVVARSYVLAEHGTSSLDRVVARMPDEHRSALAEPMSAEWYPEDALHHAFHAASTELFDGNEAQFQRMMEDCTRLGAHRFFRALLAITTPAFFLKKYPVIFKRMRRGPANVAVSVDAGAARIEFHQLPHSDDSLYHAAAIAGMNVIFELMRRSPPRIRVCDLRPESFALELDYGA